MDLGVNYSIYTIDDLYDPILNKVYSIYWNVTTIITTILLFLMLYIIIFKSSPEMGGYKWYLVHQIAWSFLFDLYLSLWKVIPLFPFYLGYSEGIFRHFSPTYRIYQIVLLCNVAVGMGFAIGISLVHRYFQASPFSITYKIYDTIPIRAAVYVFVFVSLQAAFCIPIAFNSQDFEAMKKSLVNQNSNLKQFFYREPSLFGFDPELNGKLTNLFIALILLVMFLFFIFVVFLYFNFLRILKKNKSFMSAPTYQLQLVLFKALYIQMGLIVILLLIPFYIFQTACLFGQRWSSKSCIFAVMIMSTHALADFITMVYFIRAYRIFFIETMRKILTKLGFKFNQVVPLIYPISTSGTSAAAVAPI